MVDLTDDQEAELKNVDGLLTNADKHLNSANVYQQWPTGRGVFVTDDKSLVIQVNGEDHIKITSTEANNDFGMFMWIKLLRTHGDAPYFVITEALQSFYWL